MGYVLAFFSPNENIRRRLFGYSRSVPAPKQGQERGTIGILDYTAASMPQVVNQAAISATAASAARPEPSDWTA